MLTEFDASYLSKDVFTLCFQILSCPNQIFLHLRVLKNSVVIYTAETSGAMDKHA